MPSLPPPFGPLPYRTCSHTPVSVWFTEPAGYFTRFTADCPLERAGAEFIIESFAQGMQQSAGESWPRKLMFVHDWARITRVDPQAKSVLMEWAHAIREHVASVDFVLAADASVFIRMAATVAESSLATIGMAVRSHYGKSQVEVLTSLQMRLRSGPPASMRVREAAP